MSPPDTPSPSPYLLQFVIPIKQQVLSPSAYPSLQISLLLSSLFAHYSSCYSAIFAAEEIPVKIAGALRSGRSCPEALFQSFIDTGVTRNCAACVMRCGAV